MKIKNTISKFKFVSIIKQTYKQYAYEVIFILSFDKKFNNWFYIELSSLEITIELLKFRFLFIFTRFEKSLLDKINNL